MLTKPVLYAFAAVLIVLIVLPLSWLFVYSLTDKGHVTLANFYRLFTECRFHPLVTTFIIATTSAVLCCAGGGADGLAGGGAHRLAVQPRCSARW